MKKMLLALSVALMLLRLFTVVAHPAHVTEAFHGFLKWEIRNLARASENLPDGARSERFLTGEAIPIGGGMVWCSVDLRGEDYHVGACTYFYP